MTNTLVDSIDVVLSTQLEVEAEAQIMVVRDHSALENLDYEHSGHTGFASKNYTDEELFKKVDKVEGKSLSTNDYDNMDKAKLQGIEKKADKIIIVPNVPISADIDYLIGYEIIPNYSLYKDYQILSFRVTNRFGELIEIDNYIFKKLSESKFELIDDYDITSVTFTNEGYTKTITKSINNKVDKVLGKELSSNDFTNSYKNQIGLNKDSIQVLETQLALYQFTRQQIVAKYLTEYGAFIGEVATIENLPNVARRNYEYVTNNPGTWNWLKQWLITCRSEFETNEQRKQAFISGDETFWAFEMQAFLGETYKTTYPGSTDYTIDSYANGWRPSSTIESLADRVLDVETNKVDKQQDKGLSTNDFTDDYRNKVEDTLVGDNLSDAIDNQIYERLFDGDTINDAILPDTVKNVIDFAKQVTGSDFLAQILATDNGTIVWIAANKTYTGELYYKKFAINVNGTEAGLQLFDPMDNTIYVGKTDNNCYKWSGSNLVEVSKGITLGESTTTAYQGSKGKANRDDINTLLIRVPTPPTTAGTYKLQVVVDASENPVFSWIVE